MTDWTAGYVADIGYTFGYYNELNPLRSRLPLLDSGLAPSNFETACELGFGQGMSVNLHAAASGVDWYGTDFNPSQAAFAQELAAASGAKASLFDQGFAEFCVRSDLPDFDYIGLHGIWSWISDENRAVIVDFVRRKLKVGGVLYISYNTLPGWAAFAPMRHLMTEHAEVIGSEGRGIVSRIDGALDFAEKLLATNPLYARANPQIAERVGKLKEQNRHYLAHEYFNRDWDPMHFATMLQWLAPAKLGHACSAHYLDHVDALNLTAEQQAFLREIPDAMFRETVRDFMVNQQFRRDYWVKGARRLSMLDQAEALRGQRVILAVPRAEVSLKATGALGESSMNAPIYEPILDLLADFKARTIAQISQSLTDKNVGIPQLLQALLVLVGKGDLALVQDDRIAAKAKTHTDKLNLHLMDKARGSNDLSYLASPVTGGGVLVGRFQQLFLLARSQGRKTPEDWAQFVWQVVASQGHRLFKDGKTLETAEENLAELTAQARQFDDKRLVVLKALGVA